LFNWAELNRLGGDDYRVLRWSVPADSERYLEFGIRFTDRVWADGPLELRVLRSEGPSVGLRSAPDWTAAAFGTRLGVRSAGAR